MNIVIFEDDLAFAGYMELLVSPVELVTGSLEELARYLRSVTAPTLFFLDIVSGKKASGFQAADSIRRAQAPYLIVFITDYPGKILTNGLYKMLAHNVILKKSPRLDAEIRETVAYSEKYFSDEYLLFSVDRYDYLTIALNDICYITTIKHTNKLCIHCINGEYIIRETLDRITQRLSGSFVRCHNSFIVNVERIQRIDKKDRTIHFENHAACSYSYFRKGVLLDACERFRDARTYHRRME